MVGVTGSIPVAPTTRKCSKSNRKYDYNPILRELVPTARQHIDSTAGNLN
jgi:hypothetical protein